jgi:hypothetical protein
VKLPHQVPERTPVEHGAAMSALSDKDREIDDLLVRAGELVSELHDTVGQASARLRAMEEDDDAGGG